MRKNGLFCFAALLGLLCAPTLSLAGGEFRESLNIAASVARPALLAPLFLEIRQYPAAAGGGAVTTDDNDWTGEQTFHDNKFLIVDDGDATAKLAFQLSGITTATTRTFTWPDIDGSVVLTTGAQNIVSTKTHSFSIVSTDNVGHSFGTGLGAANGNLGFRITNTPDSLFLATGSESNAVQIAETADWGLDLNNCSAGVGAATNPLICLHSNDGTSTTKWMDFEHDESNGLIRVGVGAVSFPGIGSGADVEVIGAGAGAALTTGLNNTFYGSTAGATIAGGSNNTIIGFGADGPSAGGNNTIVGAGAAIPTGGAVQASVFGNLAESNNSRGTVVGYDAEVSDGVSVGWGAGNASAIADADNVLVGSDAGGALNGTSTDNVCVGDAACITLTTGDQNSAFGGDTVLSIAAADQVAVGFAATVLAANGVAVGSGAVAEDGVVVGFGAGAALQAGGDSNTIIGAGAGDLLTTGDNNVIVGTDAGNVGTTAAGNTIVGAEADGNLAATNSFTVVGYQALAWGSQGVAVGRQAETANGGVAIGYRSGDAQGTGDSDNVFVGMDSGTAANGTSIDNTLVGDTSGNALTTGDRNTMLGANTDVGAATDSDTTIIGESMVGKAGNSILIGFGGQEWTYVAGTAVVLTDATATDLFTATVATDTGTGAIVHWTVVVTDPSPTNIQTLSGVSSFNLTNDGGSEVCTTEDVLVANEASSSGTLTVASAATTGVDLCTFQLDADTSLSAALAGYYTVQVNGPATTITPQ